MYHKITSQPEFRGPGDSSEHRSLAGAYPLGPLTDDCGPLRLKFNRPVCGYLSKWIECLKIEALLPIYRPNPLSNQSDNRYINNLSLGISQTANARMRSSTSPTFNLFAFMFSSLTQFCLVPWKPGRFVRSSRHEKVKGQGCRWPRGTTVDAN
jgi:hypothetical protein